MKPRNKPPIKAGTSSLVSADAETEKKESVLRPEILRFAELMETVMKVHDKTKGDSWKTMHESALYDMLKEEIQELHNAWDCSDFHDFRAELVDIANFCMMLRSVL